MSDQRDGGIVWTEQTWNPLRGCTRVSAGCVNCYAESMAARFCGAGQPYEGTINPETKRWNGEIKLVPEHLQDPLRWKRPRRVFVNSMSDLFHEDVPDEFIDQVFAVMALAKQHTFQVLTKRPDRMRAYLGDTMRLEKIYLMWHSVSGSPREAQGWPLPNVWLGVTVENQEAADERIPILRQTPAAVRWVSMEPLLGAVDLRSVFMPDGDSLGIGLFNDGEEAGIDWVVVGGESGPNARPMHPDWARRLRDQCEAAGVPFLFKQWGEWANSRLRPAETPGRYALAPRGFDGPIIEQDRFPRMFQAFGSTILERVGKKAAGRLLDGVLHDGYPEA